MSISRHTAQPIGRDAHIDQSIKDILSTPIGTRVMRRDYGSNLPDLIDRPINGETAVDLFQATAEAIDRWEPRLDLQRVEIAGASAGNVELRLVGEVQGVERTVGLEVAV